MRTLQAGGADIALCACNPLSTQDDVAAALVGEYGIPTFAIKGEDDETYYATSKPSLATPAADVTMDDGCDLVTRAAHASATTELADVIGGTEETTTGVIRLRAMAAEGALKFPVVAVNEAHDQALLRQPLRHRPEHDRRHPPRHQHPAGRQARRGRRLRLVSAAASRARARHGRHVIVTEIDPIRALEAVMDGFEVMPMAEAARSATSSSPPPATSM